VIPSKTPIFSGREHTLAATDLLRPVSSSTPTVAQGFRARCSWTLSADSPICLVGEIKQRLADFS